MDIHNLCHCGNGYTLADVEEVKMNREIKFRAWDKEYKEWVENKMGMFLDGLVIKYDRNAGEEDEMVFRGSGVYNKGFDNIIIQQFTGLKDKNGKEIYEGDICKFKYNDLISRYASIEFRDGSFVTNYKGEFDPVDQRFASLIEVIGNIYEDGNFLKKEEDGRTSRI